MGIQNLSSEARGFLYTLFNQAALSFHDLPGAPSAEEATAARVLELSFSSAAFKIRGGSLEEVNDTIDKLVQSINPLTDSFLKDAADSLQMKQMMMFRGIRNKEQLKADLGSYSSGIFWS